LLLRNHDKKGRRIALEHKNLYKFADHNKH